MQANRTVALLSALVATSSAFVLHSPLIPALRRWAVPKASSRASTAVSSFKGVSVARMSGGREAKPLDISVVIEPTAGSHDSTIIFLHGSGDTGAGAKEWLQGALGGRFVFEKTKIVFPTAPVRPYSLLGPHGMQRVWFDRKILDLSGTEDVEGTDAMRERIRRVIDEEVAQGVPLNRIVVGGFSMGACQSLFMLSDPHLSANLAGVFALSTFLPNCSVLPGVLWFHGTADSLIPLAWATSAYQRMLAVNVPITWRTWEGLGHDMRGDELGELHSWLFHTLYELN